MSDAILPTRREYYALIYRQARKKDSGKVLYGAIVGLVGVIIAFVIAGAVGDDQRGKILYPIATVTVTVLAGLFIAFWDAPYQLHCAQAAQLAELRDSQRFSGMATIKWSVLMTQNKLVQLEGVISTPSGQQITLRDERLTLIVADDDGSTEPSASASITQANDMLGVITSGVETATVGIQTHSGQFRIGVSESSPGARRRIIVSGSGIASDGSADCWVNFSDN